MAARIFHLESASLSGGLAVSVGDGVIGASTGTITTQCTTEAGITPGAERFTTGALLAERQPGRSTETGLRLEDTLHRAARAAHAQAPSVATSMADRRRAFLREEGPALVAEAVIAVVAAGTVVVADIGNPGSGNRGSAN